MIYTVTLNPSLDYLVTINDFKMGKTNRTSEERILPGGKGINVSIVLKNLGIDSTTLGFKAGFVGEEIQRCLEGIGCQAELTEVKNGVSRINVKFKNYEGTEINGIGPLVSEEELRELLQKISKLSEDDILVLAGSIPASVPKDIYKKIMDKVQEKNVRVVVDASGELLVNVLEKRPFLIKPNRDELEEIFGIKIQGKEDIIQYALKLQEMGARNVLVSMAGDGAVLLAENGEVYESEALKGTLVNGVGAGDSMVAGFLTGWLKKKQYDYAFKMGVAAGSASAFSENLATGEEVTALMQQFQ